jgi:hypothetical protein
MLIRRFQMMWISYGSLRLRRCDRLGFQGDHFAIPH